ncbi:MAG: sigma-70 family RNA polymerase sigma factor [Bacteroidales bacterium]|jgi:RNA polymerase sigma-70 factor (ECF subfamily)|nr:sigma-70 family RNA polymerase sigma factor [Bacteroidales bacterium]
MKKDDLNILIEECKNGNRTAQKAIFDNYKDYMLALCQRYATSNEEAEDMLMEGFLRVFQNINSYKKYDRTGKSQPSFQAWIKRVIINNAINSFYSNKKYNTNELNVPFEEKRIDMSTDYLFSEEELLDSIRKLPPFLRSIFNMSVIDDLSHDEIAKMMGIKKSSIKSAMQKAKIKIKQHLATVLIEKEKK